MAKSKLADVLQSSGITARRTSANAFSVFDLRPPAAAMASTGLEQRQLSIDARAEAAMWRPTGAAGPQGGNKGGNGGKGGSGGGSTGGKGNGGKSKTMPPPAPPAAPSNDRQPFALSNRQQRRANFKQAILDRKQGRK